MNMKYSGVVLLATFSVTYSSSCDESNSTCTPTRCLVDKLDIGNATHYNKHLIPEFGMSVRISAEVIQFSEISDMKQSFEVALMMHEVWVDHRLELGKHNPCDPLFQNLSLSQDIYDMLWTPNTCFMNTKDVIMHESPFRNVLILLFRNGTIWLKYRTTVKGPCDSHLGRFPMDKQTCQLIFASFSYNTKQLQMTWMAEAINFLPSSGPCDSHLGRFPMDKQTCQLIFESFSYNTKQLQMTWMAEAINFLPSSGPCDSHLGRFPMDKQTCQLIFESFSYNTKQLQMTWMAEAINFLPFSGPCDSHLGRFPMDKQTCQLIFESFSYNTKQLQMTWMAEAINFLPFSGPCDSHLGRFPMDKQTCQLIFESFSYNTKQLQMTWMAEAINFPKSKRWLPDFHVFRVFSNKTKAMYPAGEWEDLIMTFEVERRFGWYIFNVYVPTYVIVFFSWISFCLGGKAIPARAMLGVNALLAMTLQFASVIRNLPKVSYVKAIDTWMYTLMLFVFCSLLELAMVGYLAWREEKRRDAKHTIAMRRRSTKPPDSEFDNIRTVTDNMTKHHAGTPELSVGNFRRIRYRHGEKRTTTEWTMMVSCGCNWFEAITDEKIDIFSSVFFPALFALFNIIYWGYFLPGAGSL